MSRLADLYLHLFAAWSARGFRLIQHLRTSVGTAEPEQVLAAPAPGSVPLLGHALLWDESAVGLAASNVRLDRLRVAPRGSCQPPVARRLFAAYRELLVRPSALVRRHDRPWRSQDELRRAMKLQPIARMFDAPGAETRGFAAAALHDDDAFVRLYSHGIGGLLPRRVEGDGLRYVVDLRLFRDVEHAPGFPMLDAAAWFARPSPGRLQLEALEWRGRRIAPGAPEARAAKQALLAATCTYVVAVHHVTLAHVALGGASIAHLITTGLRPEHPWRRLTAPFCHHAQAILWDFGEINWGPGRVFDVATNTTFRGSCQLAALALRDRLERTTDAAGRLVALGELVPSAAVDLPLAADMRLWFETFRDYVADFARAVPPAGDPELEALMAELRTSHPVLAGLDVVDAFALFMHAASAFHHYSGNVSDQFLDPFEVTTSVRDAADEAARISSVHQTLVSRNTILLTLSPADGPYFPPLRQDYGGLQPASAGREVVASWPARVAAVDREIARRNATDPLRAAHPLTLLGSARISAAPSY